MPVCLRRVVVRHQDRFVVPTDYVDLGLVVEDAARHGFCPALAAIAALAGVAGQAVVSGGAPADVARAGARKQADDSAGAQAQRGFADQVAGFCKEDRPLLKRFAVVCAYVDADRAEVFVRQLAAGAGEHDGAIRQQHAVVARVPAGDVRGMGWQPGAPAVLRFAHPELVSAVAPGGKVYLGIEKFCKQQRDFTFFVFNPDRVMAAIADVATHCVGVGPCRGAGFKHGDPILGVTSHRVAVPLQKAAVPNRE
ncbi:hypothetical protein SDC9_159916 [bioreactor metagenome]|uniref:Uncharacterized protein n=1 Tax=bioreactor metagenome TaxID=1076179 RepID=A0A645FDX2_9ZZZZ